MVQAIPGEQLKRERTMSQEMNTMRMYVVHTPGYVNHSVFRFRSVGGTAFTYILPKSDPIPPHPPTKINPIIEISNSDDDDDGIAIAIGESMKIEGGRAGSNRIESNRKFWIGSWRFGEMGGDGQRGRPARD